MNTKTMFVGVVSLSIVGMIVAVSLFLPCSPSQNFVCEGVYAERVAQPLAMISLSVLVVSLVQYLFLRSGFVAWIRSATVYVTLAFLWIFSTPLSCGSLACLDRELVAWIGASGLFALCFLFNIIDFLRKKYIVVE